MSSSLIKLEKRTPQLWEVTFANPPSNLVVPEMVSALHSVVQEIDSDSQVKVLLFKSATEGFFLNESAEQTPENRKSSPRTQAIDHPLAPRYSTL